MKADVTIDCLGLYCPMPIIKTAEKIREVSIGQTIEIISDDNGIIEDMPSWCRTTGQEFLGIEDNGGEYKVYIKKIL
ncbi:MAG: sulfurtransferase TusA family protein [Bacteroidales bacterium]|nr:sulfurtransferase TusA family protein [Bacteroidales bacterium]